MQILQRQSFERERVACVRRDRPLATKSHDDVTAERQQLIERIERSTYVICQHFLGIALNIRRVMAARARLADIDKARM